jgi:hypothetical protein
MNRVEHATCVETQAGDLIDDIVVLAQQCGAPSIAADARRTSERLESARLFVSIVGSSSVLCQVVQRITGHSISRSLLDARPLSVRFGRRANHLRMTFRDRPAQKVPVTWHDRLHVFGNDIVATEMVVESTLVQAGVVYGFGTLDGHSSSHRLDLVFVDEQDARNAKLERWRGVRVFVLDTSRADELDKAFTAIERMAIETGAAGVDSHVLQHARNLCLRLEHHLYEHQRALIGATQDFAARINALTIARVLAETVLDARSCQLDPARVRLAEWLAVERTKFLMATKADAVAAFDDRLASRNRPRHQLRRDAAAARGEIVEDLLASLWVRLRGAAEPPIRAHAKRLLADLETSLGDLGETLPMNAMAGIDLTPIRGFRRDTECHAPSGVVTHLADCMRLASRRRIEHIARTEVVTRLEGGSRQLLAKVLDDYDETRYAIERRFCELIDGALDSARLAAENAKQAQAEGPRAITRARCQLEQWAAALSAIRARIE